MHVYSYYRTRVYLYYSLSFHNNKKYLTKGAPLVRHQQTEIWSSAVLNLSFRLLLFIDAKIWASPPFQVFDFILIFLNTSNSARIGHWIPSWSYSSLCSQWIDLYWRESLILFFSCGHVFCITMHTYYSIENCWANKLLLFICSVH